MEKSYLSLKREGYDHPTINTTSPCDCVGVVLYNNVFINNFKQ